MDERLMPVGYLMVCATDWRDPRRREGEGETLEGARAQPKQEIDRIVNKGNGVSLSQIKARALSLNLPLTHFL
jgi:hypothetical protein